MASRSSWESLSAAPSTGRPRVGSSSVRSSASCSRPMKTGRVAQFLGSTTRRAAACPCRRNRSFQEPDCRGSRRRPAKDETKLRLLRPPSNVGEEATVNLHSRDRAGTARLPAEADRISTQDRHVKKVIMAIAWVIDGPCLRTSRLTSTRMCCTIDRPRRYSSRARTAWRHASAGEADGRSGRTTSRPRSPPSTSLAGPFPPSCRSRWPTSRYALFGDPAWSAIGPFFYNQTRTGALGTEHSSTRSRSAGDCSRIAGHRRRSRRGGGRRQRGRPRGQQGRQAGDPRLLLPLPPRP